MTEAAVTADRSGLRVPAEATGTCQALFDGRAVWSFQPEPEPGAERVQVEWPPNLRPFLRGVTHLQVRCGERTYDAGEVRFGQRTERVAIVDKAGIPIVIDKWGIIQRPFTHRGSEVIDFMTEQALDLVRLVDAECGVQLWMAFGTLLGAVRDGGAIGHDSDMDLGYLSDLETPAQMIVEFYDIKRALTRAGYSVITKTGSFLTVMLEAPDGGPASIDIYTCFHLFEKLHLTATARAEVAREAVLPLQLIEFEGRLLPAPADPDALLAASYGASWRTPDPGFQHAPSRDVVQRFDDWFGTLMRQRRNWEVYWRDSWRPEHDNGSDFASQVLAQLVPGTTVIDVGAGRGDDSVLFAEAGHRVIALDYARQAFRAITRHPDRASLSISSRLVNLYDLRDTLTEAAELARSSQAPRVLYARNVVDAMSPDGREGFWRLCATLMRGEGGSLVHLEFDDDAPVEERVHFAGNAGRKFPVGIDELERGWREHGGREIARSGTPIGAGGTRWRILLDWARPRP